MRRKCRSLRMIEWSRHSRLTLPIRRSTYGFCHGLRGAVTTSSTPIAVTVERNDCPYAPSRSRIRCRGAVPHGNASRICCATHAIVGFAVTAKCTIWRRSWWSTMNPNRRWNVAVGDHEEIDRRQAIGVISKECPPRLRWRRWVTDDVFRDGGLGDGKAKLQKLAMDPRCAPPCVLQRHPSDQIADLPRHRWSARLSPPRLPCPEKPEPLAVPTDDGLGPDDYQGVAPTRP